MSKFNEVLEQFILATTNAKRYAEQASVLALDHYREHGDVVYLQSFADALTKHGNNFVRKQAFLTWAVTFANVSWENNKFTKDQDRKDMVIDMEAAKKLPFWDFVPERVAKDLSAADIIARLNATVKAFENTKSFILDDAAKAMLADAKKAIASLSEARKVQQAGNVETLAA